MKCKVSPLHEHFVLSCVSCEDTLRQKAKGYDQGIRDAIKLAEDFIQHHDFALAKSVKSRLLTLLGE